MSRSAQSNIKVGNIKGVWNKLTQNVDYFKRSKRGRFILCNPFTDKFLQQGPGLAPKQMERLART